MPHLLRMQPLARAALLLPLIAAACAQGPTMEQRLSTFVNRSEGELVAELGVPVRTYDVEGRRFLQYEQRRTIAYSEPGYYRPWFGPWGPQMGYWPAPTSYAVVGCDITFALRNGRVESFTYRGQGCG
jgi:hypothetical protein